MQLNQELDQFQSVYIKDLVWALLSPQLMNNPGEAHTATTAFYEQAYFSVKQKLLLLDNDDKDLQHFLQQGNDKRLGVYFERLWLYWLTLSPEYSCLGHNIQIQDHTRTIGEFDLMVANRQTHAVEHWELALKFYLGDKTLTEGENWPGPDRRDRLDIKYQKLTQQQLQLKAKPAAMDYCQAQGWHINQCRLISKGCLFAPFDNNLPWPRQVNPEHLKGQWLNLKSLFQNKASLQHQNFTLLEKRQWLSLQAEPKISYQQLTQQLELNAIERPTQIRMDGADGKSQRLFLTPNDWDN